jgi:polyisoprenoid-binding protein YceI
MLRLKSPFLVFLLLLGVKFVCLASAVTYNLSERHGKKQIVFESKAPLEYIEGTVGRIEGQIVVDTSRPDLGISASIHIPVEAMDTGHLQRNEHLKSVDWMNAANYPTLRFVLDPLSPRDISKKSQGKWFVNAAGQFQIKGDSKKVTAPVTLELKNVGGQDKLFLKGRFSLRLSDFGIRGPSAVRMMGVRVSETVNVDLNLVGVADKGWGNLDSARPRQRLR